MSKHYISIIFIKFALVEGVCAAIVDEGNLFSYKLRPETIRLMVSIVVVLTGILYSFGNGFYLLHLIDEYSTTLPFLFTCLVECLFFCTYLIHFFLFNFIKFGVKAKDLNWMNWKLRFWKILERKFLDL